MLPALLVLSLTATELPPQTQVFYNARLSLKDRKPKDTLRWWLLRNALSQQGQGPVGDDANFRSTVWAALGDLGLCPDGFRKDTTGGANLWPLALHNMTLRFSTSGEPPEPVIPFDAFEAAQQQRFISLHDVLDAAELKSITFYPTPCNEPHATFAQLQWAPPGELTDRLKLGEVLRSLLVYALTAVKTEQFRSLAVVEARLFDLNLELARLEAQQAREAALVAMQKATAKTKGISQSALADIQKQKEVWAPNSQQAEFLKHALQWRIDEWLSLSRERRLALFARAQRFADSPAERDMLAQRLVDALIERQDGTELTLWIRLLQLDPLQQRNLVSGERGKRMLALDASTGFRERAPVALARGIAFLEQGDRREALRSFAQALRTAEDSAAAAVCTALARRWLSYVLGFFETNDDIIATLKALVPQLEYNLVIDELVWKAALRADGDSFERLAASARRGGAFDNRVALLRHLSRGQAGQLIDTLTAQSTEEPHSFLRFVDATLEHVEGEDVEVRQALTPFVKGLSRLLDRLSAHEKYSKTQLRRAGELGQRAQAVLAGLMQLTESTTGKARDLTPGQSAFAGNVRLAPADALPWPFPSFEATAPSPFRPLILEPEEWRSPKGSLVFGWKVTE
jgi:hypothetical protein